MKKSVSILMAAVVLFLCASCATTKAYAPGTEDYPLTPITSKLFSNNLTCGEYFLKVGGLQNGIKQVTVLGLGIKKGVMTRNAVLYKNDVEICTISLNRSFDGYVAEGITSSTSIGDENLYIDITQGKKTYHYDVNGDLSNLKVFSSDNPYDISVDVIDRTINSKGKIVEMLWNSPVGARISAYGEEYAIVDIISDTKGIRNNPSFPVTLTESEEDLLYAIMLAEYCFESSFRAEDTSSGIKLNLF